jgi:hypothetical protein
MKIALLTAFVCAAGAFTGVCQASDVVIGGTFTGNIVGGEDQIGAFGGGSLAGDAFIYSFTADLTVLNNGSYGTDNFDYESQTDYSAAGSITESLTINGDTYSMTSTSHPDLAELFFGGAAQSSLEVDVEDLVNPYAYFSDTLPSSSAFALGTLTNEGALQSVLGNLELGTDSGFDIIDTNGNADSLVGHFTGETITPEPTTWQMLLLAFCTCGFSRGFRIAKPRRG